MRVFLEIALTGVAAVALHPQRSVATVVVLCVVLTPFLVGLGLSQGIQQEAEWSLAAGPDLYVTATRFGRPVPIPLSMADELRRMAGVDRVTPRIVGPVTLGRERIDAVLVGHSAHLGHSSQSGHSGQSEHTGQSAHTGRSGRTDGHADTQPRERTDNKVGTARGVVDDATLPEIADGRMFAESGALELVIGSQLARQLRLRPGDRLPPFYRSRAGERVARVVGVFSPDAPMWHAKLIYTSFESAAEIFDQAGVATELLVDCRPGYSEQVRQRILRESTDAKRAADWQVAVVSREQYRARLSRGVLHRDGVINLHYVLLFVGGILVVLVTSGVGLDPRRREVALLKATGWQTDEVLWRGLAESLVLSLTAAGVSIIVAYGWLRGMNGWGIARLFLAGAESRPDFVVPFRLAPLPAFGVTIVAMAITLSGTLWSTWRAAIAPPWQAMR